MILEEARRVVESVQAGHALGTSTGPGTTYTQKIPVNLLLIHEDRQRELHAGKVTRLWKLCNGYDEELAGYLDVAPAEDRPGYFYVMDGQHRLEIGRRSGVVEMWCIVHPTRDAAKQSEFFLHRNTTASSSTARESWKVRRTAGEEFVLQVEKILDAYGLHVHTRNGKASARGIMAVSTLEAAVKRGGMSRLDTMCRLIIGSSPTKPNLSENIIGGLEYFLWAYERDPQFDQRRLREVLKRLDPDDFKRLCAYHRKYTAVGIFTGPSAARALVDFYNKGLRLYRLDPLRVETPRTRLNISVLPASPAGPHAYAAFDLGVGDAS